MKQKKWASRFYGLRAHFTITLVLLALFCGLLFFVMYTVSDYYLSEYYEQSKYTEAYIQRQGESLQEFIDKNRISSKNLRELKKWEKKQFIFLLELYSKDGQILYSSVDDVSGDKSLYVKNSADEERMLSVQLTDMDVLAVLYSDVTYRYYVIAIAASAIVSMILFIFLFLRSNRRVIHYICRLNEEVQILEGGNLEYQVSVEGNDEITDLAKSMNRMRESFQQQMDTEQRLHQANRRLITEMSHDLRTPLTGMMLYLEILQSGRYQTEDELQEYLKKITAKAHHIKQISDHLFEYSLTETPEVEKAPRNMQEAFGRVINNFKDDMTAHGFTVVSDIVWTPCFVDVNDEFVQRIFENIGSNAVKYAEPSADIVICTTDTALFCGFAVMNTCAANKDPAESSGIGIESIRNMMRQMNGECIVEQTETAFEISVMFPKL